MNTETLSETTRCRVCPAATTVMAMTVLVANLFLVPAVQAQISFTDVGVSAGVQFHQESETVVPIGGGGVWADFNNDGWDDLYATQGDGCNRLFRNSQDGSFSENPNPWVASDCDSLSHGAAVADFDNDGDQDIYVTNRGQNHLFQNMLIESGEVSFVDITVAAGMDGDGEGSSASAAWGDYDGDGLLDLVVVNHTISMPIDDQSCWPDLVYHNDGDGMFTEVGDLLGIANSGKTGIPGCGLATAWTDFDNDGDLDLIVVNDWGEYLVMNKLFRNDGSDGLGGWIFSDESRAMSFDYPMFGMGVGIGDIDLNGFFDYYLSDFGANNLALNIRGTAFSELAALAGVMALDSELYGKGGLVSWGNAFVDLTGDGYEDLIVVNGGAPEGKWPGVFGEDYVDVNPVYLYVNLRKLRFAEGHDAVGMTETGYFRSVAMSDYDQDGDIDFHIGTLQGDNRLYRNDSTHTFSWLQVKAIGSISNRDGIGSRVEITVNGRSQMREVSGGNGFLARHSLPVYFGVGNSATVDRVLVTFPSGAEVEVQNVPVNQLLEIVEPNP